MRHKANSGGVIAAGHKDTVEAAALVLRAGGNAFDAVVTAMLAACVAEPVLASPGGGGFLAARPVDGEAAVYDFFTHTPQQQYAVSSADFYPIEADFGTTRQTFHIGMGSIATPGFIRGLFAIHRDLCRLPLAELMYPAIRLAKEGVKINSFQHLISTIVSPILMSTPAAFALNRSPANANRLIAEGELHRQSELADFLDTLTIEGEDLFYRGEAGAKLIQDCVQQGGHLRHNDLCDYQVFTREPLSYRYRDAQLISNPLPSLGGTLIAFALGLLESISIHDMRCGSADYLRALARSFCLTQHVRKEHRDSMEGLLDPMKREHYLSRHAQRWICNRGTTQISVADRAGNLASMTLSNGEGSGYVLPGSGIMLNNMLGEEDLNPHGFNRWPPHQRIASMMAPSLVFMPDGMTIVTGSGGSNRIRSAILQVISNLVDFALPLEQAVSHPRIHYEADLLSVEPGIDQSILQALLDDFPKQQVWDRKNLFFGGAHTVSIDARGKLSGAGDDRRGGVCKII